MFQKFVKNSKGLENNFVKIAKILIIIFMSFSVLVNFIPFFEGSNSYHYGIASILLVEEGITKSNPFLEKDGSTSGPNDLVRRCNFFVFISIK